MNSPTQLQTMHHDNSTEIEAIKRELDHINQLAHKTQPIINHRSALMAKLNELIQENLVFEHYLTEYGISTYQGQKNHA